jgi:hypothetical protein
MMQHSEPPLILGGAGDGEGRGWQAELEVTQVKSVCAVCHASNLGAVPSSAGILPPQGRVPETSGGSALQGGLGRDTPPAC